MLPPRAPTSLLSVALTMVALSASPLAGQRPVAPGESPTLADRIVAIVGDSVILLTDIQDQMVMMQQNGIQLPTDPDELHQAMREVLDGLIDLQLILQEAARDSTLLPDNDEVDGRVDQAVAEVRGRFPTSAAFQQALVSDGMSLDEYRETLRTQILRGQIRQLYLQRKLAQVPPIAVTEAEMKDLFEAQKASLQERPELLTLEQVLLRVTASDSAWAQARVVADSVLDELRAGADFAELATRVSQDPGTAPNGGDLGWFRRGLMFRQFEDVAFQLRDGQVSAPVKTPFGWHIIRVDRSRPGEVKARHILIRPETTPGDSDRTRALGVALVDSINAGASIEELNARYGEPDQSSTFTVSRDQVTQELPPGYAAALASASEGDVVGPFETRVGSDVFLAVVKVADVRAAGELTFEDLRDPILQRLQEDKKLERLYQQLRERAYIEIRF